MNRQVLTFALALVVCSASAAAQTPAATTQTPDTPRAADRVETRPATPTPQGDTTGLWFVPSGDVLPDRKWSFSLYRVNF
ncbi:MAG TPA: hypothetical protein VHJ77_18415, partial [Vicinamibacterales bacterium]|nr:hypothetical protein [Vicinamibacterales bacterium]